MGLNWEGGGHFRARNFMAAASSGGRWGSLVWWRARVLVPVLALCLAGCGANLGGGPGAQSSLPPGGGADKSPVKAALLLPLSGYGETAAMARALRQAAEMAVAESGSAAVQLSVKDDRGTSGGARAAASEALHEGAEVLLGPLLAEAVPGAATAARQRGVPVIAFSNDVSVAGNGVWLMSFLVQPEVERIVRFAAARGHRRFAALIPGTPYGAAADRAFREAVRRIGGEIIVAQHCPVDANGLLASAKAIFTAIQERETAGTPADALFIPGGTEILGPLGPLLAYSGLDASKVKLLGTGAWDMPDTGRGEAFAGAWYPAPDPRGWQAFAGRFAKLFGTAPPRLASLSYDAMTAVIALSSGPRGARFTAATLTRPSGFAGVDGLVRLRPDGLAERALAVLEVQKFGVAVIDPPPGKLGDSPAEGTTLGEAASGRN